MQIPLYEAKNSLSALITQVERDAEITITRRGIAVARLVPATPAFDRDKARRTAEALRQASQGTTLAGLSLKDLVNQGRR